MISFESWGSSGADGTLGSPLSLVGEIAFVPGPEGPEKEGFLRIPENPQSVRSQKLEHKTQCKAGFVHFG